jgi:hypothetical protein
VHIHHPEDFLIIFSSTLTKNRIAGDHFINGPGFTLSPCPWCKLAHTGSSRFEYRVELALRGIPAQAWHLSTAEHILGPSCWIERLHPGTRSRADLATFRLLARTHDPASIRTRATLEIVEQIPARVPSHAPSVVILTYPISIEVIRPEVDRTVAAAGNPASGQDGSGGGNGGGRGTGRQNRRRGRKRRRSASAPQGRADGMAVDSLGWREPRCARADGLAINRSWTSSTAAPPSPAPEKTMAPWPARRQSKSGKSNKTRRRKGKSRPKAVAASDPTLPPTGSVVASPTPDGAPAVDATPTSPAGGAPEISNSPLRGSHVDESEAPETSCADKDQSTISEVPDSQPVAPSPAHGPDPLSGQSGDSPAADPEASLDAPADRSAGPVLTVQDKENDASTDPSPASTSPAREVSGPNMGAPSEAQPTNCDGQAHPAAAPYATPPHRRYASPPITLRRLRPRPRQPSASPTPPTPWTLGDFLAAATKQLSGALPTPGRRRWTIKGGRARERCHSRRPSHRPPVHSRPPRY